MNKEQAMDKTSNIRYVENRTTEGILFGAKVVLVSLIIFFVK
jgi:hypothetical protein